MTSDAAVRPGADARAILTLAWPVFVQYLLVFLVTLSDRLLAGRFEAPEPSQQVAMQAAQTTATYLGWFLNSYGVVVSVGATALVARFVGAGDHRSANHVANQGVLLALVFGALAAALGLLWVEDLVRFLQLQGDVAAFASAYLRPLFAALPLHLATIAGIAALIGAGDTRTGLFVLGGVAILNVPLAWGFYHGLPGIPGLGFTGIAVGTAVSECLGGVAVLIILARGRAGLRLLRRDFWPNLPLIHRFLRISVPAALDSLSVALGQLWFLSVVNQLDVAASGAHGIALTWEALSFLPGTAFGVAAMTLVGQHLGGARPDLARQSGWTAYRLGCLMMCAAGAACFLLAPQMFALFCPHPEQAREIELGVPVLRLIAFAMPAIAAWVVFTPALRGAGDTRVPLLFSLFGFFLVRIPLAYALTCAWLDLGPLGVWRGANLGLFGAWIAMVTDVVLRAVLLILRFASGRWQHVRV